jgi:hypothetical protein
VRRAQHRIHPVLAGLVLAAIIAACGGGGGDETGVIIHLTADTRINTEQELIEAISAIEIMFDATGGFNGIDPGETRVGEFAVADYDGDGDRELLLVIDMGGLDHLPKGRLKPGSNLEKEIGVKARGLDGQGAVVAVGRLDPKILFEPGKLTEEWISLGFLSSKFPPRIVAVTPNDLPAGCLEAVAFYASRPLDPASLQGRVHVFEKGRESVEFPGRLTGPVSCPFGTEMWTYGPVGCHMPSDTPPFTGIGLRLDPGVTDTGGVPIQDEAGEPGFRKIIDSTLLVQFGNCDLPAPCDWAEPIQPETIDIICDSDTERFRPAPCSIVFDGCEGSDHGYAWVPAATDGECQAFRPDTLHADGICVVNSSSDSCGGGSCGDDTLACVSGECMPMLGGCAEDCREFGGCPGFDQSCVAIEPGSHTCK